jgi:hypothetical protein
VLSLKVRLQHPKKQSLIYPPSQKAANFSWRMNAERVSAEDMLAMRRIATFVANMISVGGCASAGLAEAGALVPPTSVGGAPLRPIGCLEGQFHFLNPLC